MEENIGQTVTFRDLQWDTEFFGVSCAKAVLHNRLTKAEWDELKEKFADYQFISIENRNSEPSNAQLIGSYTTAFLADVNIQFKTELKIACDMPEKVEIYQAMERDQRIPDLAKFAFSKFLEDPELAKRGGSEVYSQWLLNSFGKQDKYFVIAEGVEGKLNGFVLYSYSDKTCVIELFAVSDNETGNGMGTKLFRAVEYAACKHFCEEIRVGTQGRNMEAINFYHKCGCKQVGCHQVYHLWNL
jgi:GNAT superfamily N-acetyltransferase